MKNFIITGIFLLFTGHAYTQSKVSALYDSAYVFYEKNEFRKALEYYDRYYTSPESGLDNYGTFFAAMAACREGHKEKAIHYLKLSAKVGYDYYSYDLFIHNPNNTCLKDTPEWKEYAETMKFKADSSQASITKTREKLEDTSKRINERDDTYWNSLTKDLHSLIKNYNGFKHPAQTGFWTLYTLQVNDTLSVPYLVYIPESYNPEEKTPLYVYLHGAIVNRLEFSEPANVIYGPEAKFIQEQGEKGSFILYPFGRKDFGWLSHQEAFEAILKEISIIKSLYNIDDNRVFLGGHSNGGSGAFWFANKKQSPFAAFFAFNYLPLVYSGNTTLRNLQNQTPFYGISGTKDRVFPIARVNEIYDFARQENANWHNRVLTGGHSLPFFENDSARMVFDSVITQQRNPFPKNMIWETDDIRNGRKDWIEITALDTTALRAAWHTDLLPPAVKEGKIKRPFNRHKTGAVRATVNSNHIYLESSGVKSIRLYLSQDMLNYKQKVRIFHNGKLIRQLKLKPDNSIMMEEFRKTGDRVFIVSNIVDINI